MWEQAVRIVEEMENRGFHAVAREEDGETSIRVW